ncbi:hypothetical protein [Geodermatophilus sp. SYSU D00700]
MRSFDEAGQGLRRLADAMSELVLAPDAPPWRSNSRAAREAREEATYAGPWGEQPFRDAVIAGNLPLEVAHSHLLSMAILFPLDDVLTAPVTLGRTVSAACARSYWLLDPAADARERLRRTMNVRLATIAEAAELQPNDIDSQARYREISRAVTQTAATHDFVVRTERARPGRAWQLEYLEDKVPSEMALGRALLGDNDKYSDRQYRLGSAAVHAQSHALDLLDLRLNDADGQGGLRVDLRALLAHTAGAVLGVYKAGMRAMEHAGVPTYRWERIGTSILLSWRDGMRTR